MPRPLPHGLAALSLLLGAAGPARALQDSAVAPAPPPPPAPLFASHEPLKLTIETDFTSIFKDRTQDSEYHPGKLTLLGPDGASAATTLDIEVKTRGNFRLQSKICGFPPLRLDFPKEGTAGTPFEGQDKLKLTVHCQDKKAEYEQSVLLEYLIYRGFNLLTDNSFKARPAQIKYVDTAGKRDTLTRWAFFVEDNDAMARRIGGSVLDMTEVIDENTDLDQIPLIWMYEYFIGNTDWSVYALHNIVLVEMPNTLFPMPVPYDFDWSGVINAPYAAPDVKLPIRSVRQRLYRGFCRTAEEVTPILARFNEKKDELLALYQNQPGLDDKTRAEALAYYDEFYKTINDPRAIQREFIRSCRKAG
ncbi:MAG: hypothetical protein HY337_01800 [Gemmatimonadetes bacterium]|nr:hypothetical protein [Gemmatimonadota bacterium]